MSEQAMTSKAAFDLVIRHARVATAADVFDTDIGIVDGTITAMGRGLANGAREINAAGRWVLPGGVDAHVHLDQPSSDGSINADDFETGSRSAACGGTTTIIPFAAQQKGRSLREAIDDYHRRAEGKSIIDYAFHLIIADAEAGKLPETLPGLIEEGYTSFKLYMTYDSLKLEDRHILDVLEIARKEKAMTMIHAENADCIAWLTERLLARGSRAPSFHGVSRVPLVEREATHRAISLAEMLDTPVLIVHVSGKQAIEQIRQAQQRGAPIFAETCPQYLFLTADDLEGCEGDLFNGAKCICSPPPRDAANQDEVWQALDSGIFTVFSSDHAPYKYAGEGGKQMHGVDASFDRVPNGIPGVETRLPLLFSEGVMTGRIDIHRFVDVTATGPAKMYGLYPRKGSVAIGCDADLVIWDTFDPMPILNSALHHAVDYTPYEGRAVRAWPALTLSRGDVVWDRGSGTFGTALGRGQFLKCDRPVAYHRQQRPGRDRLFPWLADIGL